MRLHNRVGTVFIEEGENQGNIHIAFIVDTKFGLSLLDLNQIDINRL